MKNIQRLLLAALVSAIFTCTGFAQYVATDLHDFNPSTEGAVPEAGLSMDAAGNLYGTTPFFGSGGGGTVYELSPSSSGWTESILYSFVFNSTSDGFTPNGPVISDAKGNLYGVTERGGTNDFGAVYELSLSSSGWTESVLYSFAAGADGEQPSGSLTFDTSGNLYGTTTEGGGNTTNGYCESGCGTVFELSPSSSGWTEKVIYSFTGAGDGLLPGGNLLIDSSGRIYGGAEAGGTVNSACFEGCGTIFRLTPASGTWRFARIFDFQGTVGGSFPDALIFDAAGNIYGTANVGGSGCGGIGCGVIFKLSPAASGGPWKEKVLHAFTGQQDGDEPSGIVFDSKGNLFGTCYIGAKSDEGVVWELSPTTSGPWTFTQAFAFGKGNVGGGPTAGVILDAEGNIYGTAAGGGLYSHGTAFELSPSSASK